MIKSFKEFRDLDLSSATLSQLRYELDGCNYQMKELGKSVNLLRKSTVRKKHFTWYLERAVECSKWIGIRESETTFKGLRDWLSV